MGLDVYDAYTNMAIDEALCTLRSEGRSPNTIRFYRWNPSAVSIGYFQILEQEVNLQACQALGVDVIRRMTGGGAVYHSFEGEITYTLIADQRLPIIPTDILRSYDLICGGVVMALKKLDIDAAFKPINDIVVNGKKISGNAQTRRRNVVVQHGTILLDTDIKTMFTVLRVSKEKISDKLIQSVEDRVTTIRRELHRDVSFQEVTDALIESFTRVLDVESYPGTLSEEELNLAVKLREEKYRTRDWIFKRPI
jgi:lipoate-protein ligase A